MTTRVSSKGQLVLPADLRHQDGIEAGQVFDIVRVDRETGDKMGTKFLVSTVKAGNCWTVPGSQD